MDASKTLDSTAVLSCQKDSDFDADKGNRKSVSGGVVTMKGVITQWVCKKQTRVALSTMEVDYMSASHVGRELLEFRELEREIGFKVIKTWCMMMDNQAANWELEFEDSMARLDIPLNIIRDYAIVGIFRPQHVECRLLNADLLTKVLPVPKMMDLCDLVGSR